MTVPEKTQASPRLKTTYNSPTNEPFTHSISLPALSSAHSTEEKTAYLAALRRAVIDTQEKINTELTARMEEDKTKAPAAKEGKGLVDDAKEEETYGEEVVDED